MPFKESQPPRRAEAVEGKLVLSRCFLTFPQDHCCNSMYSAAAATGQPKVMNQNKISQPLSTRQIQKVI